MFIYFHTFLYRVIRPFIRVSWTYNVYYTDSIFKAFISHYLEKVSIFKKLLNVMHFWSFYLLYIQAVGTCYTHSIKPLIAATVVRGSLNFCSSFCFKNCYPLRTNLPRRDHVFSDLRKFSTHSICLHLNTKNLCTSLPAAVSRQQCNWV